MVAIGGSRSRAGDTEEARLRKLVRDRKSTSASRVSRDRGVLETSLASFNASSDDGVSGGGLSEGELKELENLLALDPKEALSQVQNFAKKVKDHVRLAKSTVGKRLTWFWSALRRGNLYHECLVQTVLTLEYQRLLDERRFFALEQVFARTVGNPTESEYKRAIENFDSIVDRFTKERERIEELERQKVKLSEARAASFERRTKEVREKNSSVSSEDMNWHMPSTESQALESTVLDSLYRTELQKLPADTEVDNNEDLADDKLAANADDFDITDESSTDQEDAQTEERYMSLADDIKISPLLRTASGRVVQTKLTRPASRRPMKKLNEETVGHAVGHGARITDVSRDLTSLARQSIREDDDDEPGPARRSLSLRSDRSDGEGDANEESSVAAFARSVNELSNRELWQMIIRLSRRTTWNLFEDPNSSKFAYWLAVFYITLIFTSCLVFCIETLPEYRLTGKSADTFKGMETFSVIMFTIEYVLRSVCCPYWRRFVIQPLNIIDVLAVLPFYLELVLPLSVSSLQILRTIRLVRVLRLLKLGVKFGRLSIIAASIGECADMLLVSLALASVSTIIFSTLMYYAEHGEYISSQGFYARKTDVVCDGLTGNETSIYQSDGSLISGCVHVESPYKSIPASFWWCVVTLMTVGYGDNVPVTAWGKAVACFTMVSSVLLLSLPISVIGTEFTRRWLDYKVDVEYEREKKLLAPRAHELFKVLKAQSKCAQEAQVDLRQGAIELDDRIQTIKALVSRRKSETSFLRRKLAIKSNLTAAGLSKMQQTVDMDDLDREMHRLFLNHRDFKSTEREVRTIWSGQKLLKFTEFLISAETVIDGLCNDDFDLVTQEMDWLFFEIWRARARLSAIYKNRREDNLNAPASAP